MLQTIREHTQGWIAGTIVGIIILTFALWGIHSYFVGGGGDTNVAEVNGVPVSKEQLTTAYERLRRQELAQYGAKNAASTKDETVLKNRALQALIEREVLKQASVAQHYRISDRQIDGYLQTMQEFQVDGQFSLERFHEVLSSSMLSTSEFLDLIKGNLLIDQPKLGIVFTSFALPNETTYTISLVNQERDVAYINIPLARFLSQSIAISPAKIQAYYEQHKSDFMTPEQMTVDYIKLSLLDLTNQMRPTDTMLKSFYSENINSYTQPMQWKLATIEIAQPANASTDDYAQAQKKADLALAAVKKGDDMATVAKHYAGNLVNVNWMALNQIPVEMQKAVANLTKPGQVAESLVKGSKGFVIVKVVDLKEPQIQTFETVQDKVKESYVRQHAEEKFAELRDQLADLTYEHPDSLQLAAKTLNVPMQTSELFTKEKPGTDITQFKKVRDIAFSNDVLNLQNNSDVIQINPETVIVIHLKSHVPSRLMPLQTVSNQIAEKLSAAEAETLAATFAQDLKTKLQAGANPQDIADANQLSWSQTGLIGRYATKVDSAILDLAFRLPNPATTQNKAAYGVTRLPNGYAIVSLKAVKNGTINEKRQNDVFAEQIQNSEGLLEYELYKQSQINKAKISLQQ